MKNKLYVIGLMSGTSCDGLSIAYCMISFRKRYIKVLNFETYSYPSELQNKIMKAREIKTAQIVELSYELGRIWSVMIERFIKKYAIKKIDLISSHGQTVYHSSEKRLTFQIGEVEFITRKFNVPVAFDFRTGDIICGGEGAPLIPFMDEFVFGKNESIVCLLNIGGVANISVVGKKVKTFGFDVGPGNSLMDWAMNIYSGGVKRYDKDGLVALHGKVDFRKIDRFMKNPFFAKKPPKSLDREEFGERFVRNNFDFKKEKIEDILATLNYFTAISVKYAIDRFVRLPLKEIIVSGGGVFNRTLMKNLSELFKGIKVTSISDYSIHPLAKEAAGFALLGAARLLNVESNCPHVTGAGKKIVLGKLSLP